MAVMATSLAVQGGLNCALSSLHSSPLGASPGAAHRHSLSPADAQLALPPASSSHPASPRRLPAAWPPAAHPGGPAPHPPHLCCRRHHPTQRQRCPPQWRGRQRALGWSCHPWPCQQGWGEEEWEGKGHRAIAAPHAPAASPSHGAVEEGPCGRLGGWKLIFIPCQLGHPCLTLFSCFILSPPPSQVLLPCYPLMGGKQGWATSGLNLCVSSDNQHLDLQICSGAKRCYSGLLVIETGWPSQKPSALLRGRSWWWYQPRGRCHRHSKTLDHEWQELFYCSRNISVSCRNFHCSGTAKRREGN